MKFDPFVLPFTIGLVFMAGMLLYRYINWIIQLVPEQREAVRKNFLSMHTIFGLREVFFESLLHRKIFKKNRLLGYMHMSLAFGWLLLIIVGHFETSAYFGSGLEAPYVPIFLRYFQMDATHPTAQPGYWFFMDTILLFVLSGVFLAWYKRRRSQRFGLIKTTQHTYGDRIALTVLWFIFPFRLLAESISSILYGGGSYLTFGLGSLMEGTIATWFTFYTSWWAYSISLGIFFVSLPFSRYMHIPTEVGLIMLRHWGVIAEVKKFCGMSQFEINSCSSCGICLDACQLINDIQITNIQTPYLFKAIRSHSVKDNVLHNCLMCGRCINPCVVGINTTKIRQATRNKKSGEIYSNLDYLHQAKVPAVRKAEVIYFAGCMSHLTPGIKKSMTTIFATAGVRFALLDEHESICCGRPMMLAGMTKQAEPLIRKNKEIIEKSGVKTLITSCPICYKVFKEEYNLNIEVLHHTQFIDRLVTLGKIALKKSAQKVSYHDPCELGRGSGIYEESRNVLRKVAILEEHPDQKEQSLCCGGSIANSILTSSEKRIIARSTLEKITTPATDALITSCPLCKKTFAQVQQNIEIKDIAEFVEQNLTNASQLKKEKQKNKALNESVVA
jgi:Fe-S oxidoreductase